MSTVRNKTQKPLSLPLPGGKVLHLGPTKSGQISAKALDQPGLKKLVEAGEIEVMDTEPERGGNPASGKRGGGSLHGHTTSGGMRRSGDR